MAMLGMIMQITGTVMAVDAQKQEGKARREIGNMKADQLEEDANQAIAISQQEKERERERKNLLASRALVLSAAGGSASDVTSIKLMSDIDGEGALRESIALYRGEEEARRLRKGADITRYGGQVEYAAAKTRSTATILKGAGSFAASRKPTTNKTSYG